MLAALQKVAGKTLGYLALNGFLKTDPDVEDDLFPLTKSEDSGVNVAGGFALAASGTDPEIDAEVVEKCLEDGDDADKVTAATMVHSICKLEKAIAAKYVTPS